MKSKTLAIGGRSIGWQATSPPTLAKFLSALAAAPLPTPRNLETCANVMKPSTEVLDVAKTAYQIGYY